MLGVINNARKDVYQKETPFGLFYERHHYTPEKFGKVEWYCFGFFASLKQAKQALTLVQGRTRLLSELFIKEGPLEESVILINPFSSILAGTFPRLL